MQRLSSDQFAFLAGHEIAHYYLGHSHSSIANEFEADALGALLACRAGFRLDRGDDMFSHVRGSRAHPAPLQRRKAMMGTAASFECSGKIEPRKPVRGAIK